MCDNLSLLCALCRLGFYSVFTRCCGKKEIIKPEFSPICIGLTGAGKSTVLALLSGEKSEDIEPTSGFSIKAILFEDCILNVKEIGGADKVRPYWSHYYDGAQGVIFVVNAASTNDDLMTARDELKKSIDNKALGSLPCFILATHKDENGAKSEKELQDQLEIHSIMEGRQHVFGYASTNDLDELRQYFKQYNRILIDSEHDTVDNNRI